MWPSSISRCRPLREMAGKCERKNVSSRSAGSDFSTVRLTERLLILQSTDRRWTTKPEPRSSRPRPGHAQSIFHVVDLAADGLLASLVHERMKSKPTPMQMAVSATLNAGKPASAPSRRMT